MSEDFAGTDLGQDAIRAVSRLASIEPVNLVRRELGSASFEVLQPLFQDIQYVYSRIDPNWHTIVPGMVQVQFASHTNDLNKELWGIGTFDVGRPNANKERNDLINRSNITWEALLPWAHQVLSYQANEKLRVDPGFLETTKTVEAIKDEVARLSGEVRKTLEDEVERIKVELNKQSEEQETVARNNLEKLANETEEKLRPIQALGDEMSQIVKEAKEGRGELKIADHAVHFADEASTQDETANAWLLGAAGMGAFLFLGGVLAFTAHPHLDAVQNFWQYLLVAFPRFVLFGLGFGALGVCIRNHRANRHNFVVNRHRSIALSSFDAMVGAAERDQDTKNAVLLRATETIFAPASSGYLGRQDGARPGAAQILEIMRRSAMSSSSGTG